jgi:endonuclease-3
MKPRKKSFSRHPSSHAQTEQPTGARRGRETAASRAARAETICRRLAQAYPDATCSLDFRTPFELLIATILSAQCTDKRVNMVTGGLFRRWPTPGALAAAPPAEVESVIRSTGFFRAKAKSIRGCCQGLVERHAGDVPRTLKDLVQLPGVGRKTANVVMGSAFGEPTGVVVDTHVGRISRRLGLTRQTDAVRAERDLGRVLPRSEWIAFSHRLIEHGRSVCLARKPRCETCVLLDCCPQVGVTRGAGTRGKAAPHGQKAPTRRTIRHDDADRVARVSLTAREQKP